MAWGACLLEQSHVLIIFLFAIPELWRLCTARFVCQQSPPGFHGYKDCMQALVSTTDSVDAFGLLQNMAPMSYDSSRLIDVACISFSTTDHAHLAALQARHRQTVLAQFAVRPPRTDLLFAPEMSCPVVL